MLATEHASSTSSPCALCVTAGGASVGAAGMVSVILL